MTGQDQHNQYCVFCREDVEAWDQAWIYTSDDYVGTPLGEDVPKKQVGLCADHLEMLDEVPYVEE